MCAIQRVNGQGKIFKCCCVFHTQQFPVLINNGPPPKGHPANSKPLWEALKSTWASIPVERFRHLVEHCLTTSLILPHFHML